MNIQMEDECAGDAEKMNLMPVPDGQERLATQPERDDVNGRIERSVPCR